MKIIETPLADTVLIEPKVFGDERGYFLESYNAQRYIDCGIPLNFVQDNESHSRQGILRGLHYQLKRPQGKLVRVIRGKVFDVAVDIRRGSPFFGRWHGVYLSGENKHQFYIPPGFAHGFVVLSETADFLYKCTDYYAPDDEYGILWNDHDIQINWPQVQAPILSQKDQNAPTLSAIAPNLLPLYSSSSSSQSGQPQAS